MSGLEELLAQWGDNPAFMRNVTRWEVLPAREGTHAGFPDYLDQRLGEAPGRPLRGPPAAPGSDGQPEHE